MIRKSYEGPTENGYIRSLCVKGSEETVGTLAESLERTGASADQWLRPKERARLFFCANLWGMLGNS